MFPADVLTNAKHLIDILRDQNRTLTTAESCTGGLVAAAITAVPGSSDVFYGGFVTYSNDAKEHMIGVDAELIKHHGAVSEAVAHAMAECAVSTTGADLAVSITGIAGPGGGSPHKPVGLVYIAIASVFDAPRVERHMFGEAGRDEVRLASLRAALRLLEEAAK
ncbi:CinA family protein [Hyphomicrobium sp. MC1]|uniref:CinA family protein n=1 Tax=Hyphomicrobium sp. (strain MC1) TaxID=717785 RepID=UPI000213E65D|nr:CinA family protein [Hyphomicrobium sp. MC1]CCB65302.1 CinA (competence-damaged protein) family protein [Hyphomicrobium sp. MC1]